MARIGWLGLLACTACTWDGGLSGVAFSCPDGRCPAGQRCLDGMCVAGGDDGPDAGGACAGTTRFADEFETELDLDRWEIVADGGAVAHAAEGVLAIDYEATESDAEARMIEPVLVDDAVITLEVDAPPDISSSFIRLRLFDDEGDGAPLEFFANTFDLQVWIDSDFDVPQMLRQEPYDPQEYRWWRISRAGDEACFSTSRDGAAFDEFACGSSEGVRSSLRAGLGAGNYAGAEPQSARFDHFTWCGP